MNIKPEILQQIKNIDRIESGLQKTNDIDIIVTNPRIFDNHITVDIIHRDIIDSDESILSDMEFSFQELNITSKNQILA